MFKIYTTANDDKSGTLIRCVQWSSERKILSLIERGNCLTPKEENN